MLCYYQRYVSLLSRPCRWVHLSYYSLLITHAVFHRLLRLEIELTILSNVNKEQANFVEREQRTELHTRTRELKGEVERD